LDKAHRTINGEKLAEHMLYDSTCAKFSSERH
jgi:hypothetical protein